MESPNPIVPDLPPDSSLTVPAKTEMADRNFVHIALIIVFGMIATTLAQTQVLGKLPIQNLLKGHLHVSREQMAAFFFWAGLAWYCKPVAGLLTDAFPLFRTRRRWYLLISSICACGCWIALGLVPHTYKALLLAAIVVEACLVMASTVVGGFLVEAGQALQATGRLTAIRMLVMNACLLVQGPVAGFLASGAFMIAAGANAAVALSIFPIAYLYLREKPTTTAKTAVFINALDQLKKIGRSKTMWLALLFIGLFYFAPGFSTLLYYRQTDQLKFTQQFIGNLNAIDGGAGVLAAILYSRLIRRLNIKTIIFWGIATTVVGTMFYLFYNNKTEAMLVEAEYSFFFFMTDVALTDLAARATPSGCEGLGYALILSVRNIAYLGADYVGSHFADKYNIPFSKMVYVNAGTTAIVLVLLPLMSRLSPVLMTSVDKSAAKEK
ncbi:MAG TPA: MFS transporter [Opitutaceae bacterium]|nr:MFS transporter [Opitutaceae bacterium]